MPALSPTEETTVSHQMYLADWKLITSQGGRLEFVHIGNGKRVSIQNGLMPIADARTVLTTARWFPVLVPGTSPDQYTVERVPRLKFFNIVDIHDRPSSDVNGQNFLVATQLVTALP